MKTKFTVELNKGAVRLFERVLGTRDPKAIANDIFDILLAEFEWNGAYKNAWHQLDSVEWIVYPS